MENVILIVHLLLALSLIGIVLMQRSEGGGLGIGGGGGAMTARGAGTALGRLTWILAACFIATSLTLTILAASDGASSSIMDRLGRGNAAATETTEGDGATTGDGGMDADSLLPPPSAEGQDGAADEDAPLVPRAD